MPDRIVGPLTMIQFVEAVLGGGLAYIIYSSLPSPLNSLLAIITAVFTLAVVFVKINERPFLFYLLAFIRFVAEPKQRIWQKDSPDNFEVEIYKPPKNESQKNVTKKLDKGALEELANQLDSQDIKNMKM